MVNAGPRCRWFPHGIAAVSAFIAPRRHRVRTAPACGNALMRASEMRSGFQYVSRDDTCRRCRLDGSLCGSRGPSVVLSGGVRGSPGTADGVVGGVALPCGEVMLVRPDYLGHLIPVTFINTCDQARFRTTGEAKL